MSKIWRERRHYGSTKEANFRFFVEDVDKFLLYVKNFIVSAKMGCEPNIFPVVPFITTDFRSYFIEGVRGEKVEKLEEKYPDKFEFMKRAVEKDEYEERKGTPYESIGYWGY